MDDNRPFTWLIGSTNLEVTFKGYNEREINAGENFFFI